MLSPMNLTLPLHWALGWAARTDVRKQGAWRMSPSFPWLFSIQRMVARRSRLRRDSATHVTPLDRADLQGVPLRPPPDMAKPRSTCRRRRVPGGRDRAHFDFLTRIQ